MSSEACALLGTTIDLAAEVLYQAAIGTFPLAENDQRSQLKTFSRKGRPHRSSGTPLQPVHTQTDVKGSAHQLQPAIKCTRSLKQTHLDLGQAGFHCRTCVLCGMTYCPGEEADEELHAAHHAKLMKGIRFHGWQNERVLHRDGLSGYVLLVLPTDPAPHLKKVKELAELLEEELGLVHGWLMSVPCKVYLYVSASKRVLGCVMLHSIQSACPAIPAEHAAASTGDSSAGKLESTTPLGTQRQPAGVPGRAGPPAKTNAEPRLHSGVFSSAACTVSSTQECSDTQAMGRSVFSEPAGHQLHSGGHLKTLTPAGRPTGAARCDSLAPSCSPELSHTAPVKSRKRSWVPSGVPGRNRASLGSLGTAERHSKAQLQRQQSTLSGWLASAKKPAPKQKAARSDCSMGAPPSPSASCCSGATRASTGLAGATAVHKGVLVERDLNQQSASSQERAPEGATSAQHVPPQQQHADADMQHSSCRRSISMPDCRAEAEHRSVGRDLTLQEQSTMLTQQHLGRQPCRAREQWPPHLKSTCQAPLLVDGSRMVAAVCGVRVVWVSGDSRRQGIASKLLDLARCNFLAGYVVPRHELAFTQPTEQGRSFAASYTGSDKLFVYQ